MHIPFTPNHIQLVSACYPPSAALLTSGPEYRPNSQELSRLTYYAANRPGKINKLSNELEKRIKIECRKAQAGNIRARASLLITLYIFKSLATECRRDMSLLSSSLVSSVNVTLSALSSDLEIAARAASVFTAWTTYTDGHLIGVDRHVTEDYLSCLQNFSRMGHIESDDHEVRNRCRLVGLAALMAAVNSEALYHSFTHFQSQVSVIMRALLAPLLQVEILVLEHEAAEIKEQPNSAILEEFRTRPALERRAASIHIHIDGDKGPSSGDVANTALRAMSSLLGHTNGAQSAVVLKASFDCLDGIGGWDKVEHCQWIAEKAAEWTQYQYRYAIPSRLVERLVEDQDAPQPTARHNTLAAMVKTVFTSPVPLVNLSTSDIIASLITLTLRRTSINAEDPLLPALVECVSSLGTHVYYADQIQDLAAELISRLVIVEASGIPGGTKSSGDKSRMQAVRCLLAGLLGLIHAADMHDTGKDGDAEDDKDGAPRKLGTSPALPSAVSSAPQEEHVRPSRRTKIAPEVWQDTLTLLCDEDYAVRADYAIALVSYIQKEIPKLGECTDPDGVKRTRPLAEGPSQRVSTVTAMMYGDATTRFLNALHAYVYALATSSTLGLYSSSSSSSPERSVNGSGALEGNQSRESPAHSRRSITVPSRSRKCSIVLHVLHQAPTRITSPISIAAVLSDYTDILAVLIAVHEQLPVRGLLTGLPMLLALDRAVQVEEPADAGITQLLWTIKKVVAQTWAAIGKVWDCPMVIEMAEKVLSVVTPTLQLPSFPELQPGTYHPPLKAVNFEADASIDGPLPSLDTEALIAALTSNQNVQDATGLDQQALSRRLGISWTAESAFRDSLETQTNFDSLRGDGLSPLIKVAPALMHVENLSLQSLARSTRGVGVTDLREALEGRSSMSNPNLANKAPSISTLDHMSAIVPGEPFPKLTPTRSRPQRGKPRPGEVRDVLNKLGIGKQNGSSMLRSSFPLQKSQSRNAPAFSAPYKT